MEKTGIFKGVLGTEKHIHKSGLFAVLIIAFLLIKVAIALLLPARQVILASDFIPLLW